MKNNFTNICYSSVKSKSNFIKLFHKVIKSAPKSTSVKHCEIIATWFRISLAGKPLAGLLKFCALTYVFS